MIGITQIDHICIAVRDLPKAMVQWEKLLGKEKPDLEYIHDEEAIQVARYYVGEVGYELMCSTRDGSDVDKKTAGDSTSAGRCPICSWPDAGLKSVQTRSPRLGIYCFLSALSVITIPFLQACLSIMPYPRHPKQPPWDHIPHELSGYPAGQDNKTSGGIQGSGT